jgi:hypothetical protein
MTISNGFRPTGILDTVAILKLKGMSTWDAIKEVESKLRGPLPEHIRQMILREVN